ncbi:SDR family oxidoreductase [Streptomyces sp. NPDC058542]|uniref:SDR family oxidoreductase n=1 Tax=Streptomyces sp. NPDC058542 TaxID=3346543 RepID=UPI003669C63C
MSKAALESLTRGAAVDLGPRIRVNAVAPGPIQTGWMDDELVNKVVPSIPMNRVGHPTDIADACVSSPHVSHGGSPAKSSRY